MEFAGTVLYCDDVPPVLDFYRRAFGVTSKFEDLDVQLPGRVPASSYQFAELATRGGALFLATHALGALLMPGYERPVDGQPAGVEVAFFTDKVQRAFDRAVGAGAQVLAHPKMMPWGQTVSYVRSIEGTCVGLCSPLDSGAADDGAT